MTSSEAARKNWKALKDKPLKDKLEHIVTYYGAAIVVIGILLIVAVSYTIHVLTVKDTALNITCVTGKATQSEVDKFTEQFAQFAEIDLNEYEVNLSTKVSVAAGDQSGAYDAAEMMLTMVAANSVDVISGDKNSMIPYFYHNIFADLTNVLTESQQALFKDSFLYMDMEHFRKLQELSADDEFPEYPDPTKPETMKEPVPVAIILDESSAFRKLCYSYTKTPAAIGFAVNAPNMANAMKFLDYVTNEVAQ